MKKFHPLRVAAKRHETRDSICIALDVPQHLRPEFDFQPGQHLPVQVSLDGRRVRRTYSICSEPGRWPVEIGVRIQPGGLFSGYADKAMSVGDTLEAMPPTGGFHASIDPDASKYYLGFAAGSGITPLLSIATAVLNNEPGSRFALFYGNRRQDSTMFIEDLWALKNRFPDRLQLHFVFSQEQQEFAINAGRIDAKKVKQLYERFCSGDRADEAYVCGPDTMIESVADALQARGMPKEAIHAERFGVPRRASAERPKPAAVSASSSAPLATVTVIMDGHRKSFEMSRDAENIVDAAAETGIELPYSCKGGVCATCRTHVSKGAVTMKTNYGLEPWELEAGFVLACQSRPQSDELVLDYDKS